MLPFFQWCYGTWIGETIRESTWLFPLIEAFHLVGLGLTAGTVLTVDLRLLGVGLSRQSAAQLWASVQPWFLGSLSLMFVTGILLFMSEAIKCYYSFAFWIKMASLLLAIVFCGRMIAYNWFDCDRQPQAAIVNFLTSCVAKPSEF